MQGACDLAQARKHEAEIDGRGALAKLDAERGVWKDLIDGIREILAGGGKRIIVMLPRDAISPDSRKSDGS